MESPKKESQNFLDALPLMHSEDSDPLVVLNSDVKSKYKKKRSKEREKKLIKYKENKESKESFELLSQTVDSQENNKESTNSILNKEVDKTELYEKVALENSEKNYGLSKCEVRPSQITELKTSPVKIEYKMEDLSIFYITIIPPDDEEGKKDCQGFHNDSQKLFVEKDLFLAQDLKACCPKVPKKSLPWTIFGAGIAAFIVFIIIIIKIRRGIKR